MKHATSEWYEKVPKGPVENARFRERLLAETQGPNRHTKALKDACRWDVLFYVNAFVFTFDPRKRAKRIPFITWPFQDKALLQIVECIEEGRDLVIEKSRDMGASWMSLTVMEWLWHFHPGHSFLMVSRKEDLVDAPGDPDSLFWKVDFIHRHLPRWLRPATDRRKLHFGNLDNGSTIDGESTTAAAGVGGRRTAMFIDEFSRIEEGYQLLAGTADTTRCRIFNFTPWGTSNAAYKLARRGDVRKLRLHWSEHPEKSRGLYRYDEKSRAVQSLCPGYKYPDNYNFITDGKLRSPWYDGECVRRANDREVAQMLDIDYQGSQYQFFDRSQIVDLQHHHAMPPFWEGDVSYDPDTGKPLGLVKSSGGMLKLWCRLDADGNPPQAPYGGGADLATGSGATNSCLSFVDGKTGEKVLEYANPYLRPDQMALRAAALCWLFKDKDGEPVKFAWEHAGPGQSFGKSLMGLGYNNYYRREPNQAVPSGRPSELPGWVPTNDNKRLLLEEYRAALYARDFVNHSHEALEECLAFIVNAKSNVVHDQEEDAEDPTGARVNHGDRVIADALAWKMANSFGLISNRAKKREAQEGPPHGSLAHRRLLRHNLRRWEEEER